MSAKVAIVLVPVAVFVVVSSVAAVKHYDNDLFNSCFSTFSVVVVNVRSVYQAESGTGGTSKAVVAVVVALAVAAVMAVAAGEGVGGRTSSSPFRRPPPQGIRC